MKIFKTLKESKDREQELLDAWEAARDATAEFIRAHKSKELTQEEAKEFEHLLYLEREASNEYYKYKFPEEEW